MIELGTNGTVLLGTAQEVRPLALILVLICCACLGNPAIPWVITKRLEGPIKIGRAERQNPGQSGAVSGKRGDVSHCQDLSGGIASQADIDLAGRARGDDGQIVARREEVICSSRRPERKRIRAVYQDVIVIHGLSETLIRRMSCYYHATVECPIYWCRNRCGKIAPQLPHHRLIQGPTSPRMSLSWSVDGAL
ncbi:hypothetical protein FB451DRAFT_1375750 [Mycena latifolia]|nr:hypothetical protein FB451DRAFT_1375750 [Mycena latifolia]